MFIILKTIKEGNKEFVYLRSVKRSDIYILSEVFYEIKEKISKGKDYEIDERDVVGYLKSFDSIEIDSVNINGISSYANPFELYMEKPLYRMLVGKYGDKEIDIIEINDNLSDEIFKIIENKRFYSGDIVLYSGKTYEVLISTDEYVKLNNGDNTFITIGKNFIPTLKLICRNENREDVKNKDSVIRIDY